MAMSKQFSLSNLSTGLAINYYTGALHILLRPDFKDECKKICDRVKAENKEKIYNAFQKTVIVIPNSCNIAHNLETYGSEFERTTRVSLEKNAHNGLLRTFTTSMYHLQDKEAITHLVGIEVPNIITTLHKLSVNADEETKHHLGDVSLMSRDELELERENFVTQFTRLVDILYNNHYIVVHFDEKTDQLSNVILDAIKLDGSREIPTKVETGKTVPEFSLGQAYKGLSWATALNYLLKALPGKVESIKKEQERASDKKADDIVYAKLLLLGETNCRTLPSGKKFEDFPGIERVVVATETHQVAGTERVYSSTLFRVTHTNKRYLVSAEYMRALVCLGEIERLLRIPISSVELTEQAKLFYDYFSKVIRSIPVLNQNCFLHSYDEEENQKNGELDLAKIIAEGIEADINPIH